MFDAFDARDVDRYLSYLTDDVVLAPPGILLGKKEFIGHDQVRSAFADLEDSLGPEGKLHLRQRRYYFDRADGTKILVTIELTLIKQGIEPFGAKAAFMLTMAGNKASRMDSWASQEDALAQLEDPVAVSH